MCRDNRMAEKPSKHMTKHMTRYVIEYVLRCDIMRQAVPRQGRNYGNMSVPPGNVPPGNVPPGNVPPGNVPPGNVPPGNVPPGNVPPGNVPPGNVPPAPPRSAGRGWKIFGIGCLVLFLAAAIGGVVLVRNVKDAIIHPNKGSVIGVGVLAGQAGADGARLQQAIVAYRAAKGHYPRTLTDLVTDGTVDGKLLHNDLDDSPNPGHISWRYTPPAEGAPGTTPILAQTYQLAVAGRTAPQQIVITLDGKLVSGNKSAPLPSPESR